MKANKEDISPGKRQSFFNIDPCVDYSTWYRRVLFEANIIDNRYPLKGMYVWRGNGMFMRKRMFQLCEDKWREMGMEEVEMPTLMPNDLLNKMEEHALGYDINSIRDYFFRMENYCYQVTKSGLSTLTNPLLLLPSTHPSLHTLLSNIVHEG